MESSWDCYATIYFWGQSECGWFLSKLSQSDMFDQKLQSKVLKLVDKFYGGENGFNQVIELSTEVFWNTFKKRT